MFRYIQPFKKGDEVPSWMLDVEPAEAGGKKPTIRFGFDCHVVEVTMRYYVISDNESSGSCVFSATDGDGGHSMLFAPSRTVYAPVRTMVVGGDDDRGPDAGPRNPEPIDDINRRLIPLTDEP